MTSGLETKGKMSFASPFCYIHVISTSFSVIFTLIICLGSLTKREEVLSDVRDGD